MPFVPFWTLALVTLLVTCGLYAMLPRRYWNGKNFVFMWNGRKRRQKDCGDGFKDSDRSGVIIEEGDDENNPFISVRFGSVSRYLHSERLESAMLDCSCGSLEVYFDNVRLSPGGAEVTINCRLGNVEIYIPRGWRIIDNLSTTLGNCEVDGNLYNADENAPLITLKGNLSLGNVEVKRIG